MRYVLLVLLILVAFPVTLAEPIKVTSPFGTPLAGARVQAVKLDGTIIEGYLDQEGCISIREVPLGILTFKILSWRGFNLNYKVTVTMYNTSITCYTIGRLSITAKTVLGQPLKMAHVKVVSEDGISEELVLRDGSLNIELPAGRYSVTLSVANKRITKEVEISGGSVVHISETLPVVELFGTIVDQWYPLYVTMVLIVVIIILVLGMYELTSYLRARKLKKMVERVTK